MKTYQVRYSPHAVNLISAYADNIAERSQSLTIAERWIHSVFDAIDQLDQNPKRFGLAEESRFRDYDIHRQVIGSYLALYTVHEEAKIVRVIGFRHGRQLPRPEQLPATQ